LEKRTATVHRRTKETEINLSLDFSTHKETDLSSGIPFFDHILEAMAFHGGFSLKIKAKGDVHIDPHHLVEDTGIVMGEALQKIVKDFGSVHRYGYAVIPMDEALSEVSIDVCERSCLVFKASFPQEFAGSFHVVLVREFLKALSNRAKITIHAACRYGENSHHMAESLFKALGKALYMAYMPAWESKQGMSTKGTL